MATYENQSSDRGGSGFESQGESSDESVTFDYTFVPVPDGKPYKEPKQVNGTAERRSGGAGGSNSLAIVNRGPAIGIDPFGNIIYEIIPNPPVYRVYYDLNPGWNTRATIQEPIGPTCYFSYKSGYAVGAIVGFTPLNNASAGHTDIILGYMTQNGVAYIISHGEILFAIPTATTEPEPGSYNRQYDSLVLRKTINKVEFLLSSDEGQGGETKIGEATIREPVTYISAALYLGGDTIGSEILEYPDVLAGEMPPLVGGFFESATASYLMGSIPALTGTFYESDYNVMGGNLPSLTGLIGDNRATFMRSSLPAMTGSLMSVSDDAIVPEFNFTFADIPSVHGEFFVRDVTFGTIAASLPAVTGFMADADVSIMRGSLPALTGGMYEQRYANRFTFVNFAYCLGQMASRETSYLVLNSTAGIVAAFTLDAIEVMRLQIQATVSGEITLDSIIYQLLSSVMSASDVAALKADGMSVWALHMDVQGSTRYDGYDFNSFMTLDGETYGVNSTGIHKLSGTTDNGENIFASVDLGSLDFGSNNRKALPYVYVGMSSTGKTVLKIESDDETYYYEARDSTGLMKAHRFEPGRGLRSTFYGVSIESDGEAFDLHNIEFQPVALKRSL